MNRRQAVARREMAAALCWTLLLAGLFSQIEIQIEGGAGWATSLPTWRIEQHWLLDVFFSGRAMTGYHAWVLPFIALFFHFPACLARRWTMRRECLVLACIIVFWLVEDFLWFATNPAFGLDRFSASFIPWHKHLLWGRRSTTGPSRQPPPACSPIRPASPGARRCNCYDPFNSSITLFATKTFR
ncbi:MAG: hypothetical protein ABWY05_10320 [Noviherbaspirillum sp.]